MGRLSAQLFQVSSQNDFARLEHIGDERAGVVTFVEPGQVLPQAYATGVAGDVEWLRDAKLNALQDELPRRTVLAGDDGFRRAGCLLCLMASVLACRATSRPARIF